MPGYRILVVDDQPELLRLLSTFLPRHGHTVTCCTSGAEGLAVLRTAETPYHLAILDLYLPDIDGRELAGVILTENAQMRVLIASGALFERASLGEVHASRAAVLQKPYVPKALVDAIEQLMNTAV